MPYLTPNSIPTTSFICRRLLIPDDIDILIAVNGALDELGQAENWEQFGTITPDEIATAMDDMYRRYELREACLIGSVLLYATTSTPDGTLPCDGSTHLRVDYPGLYSVLAAAYITDGDHFVTPNPVGLSGLNYFIVAQ